MVVALLIGIIFAIAGIIIIVVAISKKQKCTEVTTAKVVDISREETPTHHRDNPPRDSININGFSVSSGSSGRDISLYPIFEYEVNGTKYVKKGSSGSNSYHIGQELEIHYDPSNPDQYYIKSTTSQVVAGAIFAVVGIIITIAGIASF